jgi:hypothetical protein
VHDIGAEAVERARERSLENFTGHRVAFSLLVRCPRGLTILTAIASGTSKSETARAQFWKSFEVVRNW